MYLSMLENDHKYLFLDLDIYLSKVDGDFSEAEKTIINVHCQEMHIDNNSFETRLSLDSVIERIKTDLSDKEKKIVFFELAATVMADEVFRDSEKELLVRLSELLDINQDEVDEVFSIVNDLKAAYKRCSNYISEV